MQAPEELEKESAKNPNGQQQTKPAQNPIPPTAKATQLKPQPVEEIKNQIKELRVKLDKLIADDTKARDETKRNMLAQEISQLREELRKKREIVSLQKQDDFFTKFAKGVITSLGVHVAYGHPEDMYLQDNHGGFSMLKMALNPEDGTTVVKGCGIKNLPISSPAQTIAQLREHAPNIERLMRNVSKDEPFLISSENPSARTYLAIKAEARYGLKVKFKAKKNFNAIFEKVYGTSKHNKKPLARSVFGSAQSLLDCIDEIKQANQDGYITDKEFSQFKQNLKTTLQSKCENLNDQHQFKIYQENPEQFLQACSSVDTIMSLPKSHIKELNKVFTTEEGETNKLTENFAMLFARIDKKKKQSEKSISLSLQEGNSASMRLKK